LEPRLVPLNAVIALIRGHGGWPNAFEGDGLDVRWLEVPVTTSEGVVTVDVLAYSTKHDLLVPIEVKSGANADEEQARKYANMTAEDVLRLATVTGTRAGKTAIEPMYVALKENEARIALGLEKAGLSCPVLVIDTGGAELKCEPDHQLSPFVVALPSPPPAVVPIDAESPPERYLELAIAHIVARAASGERSISLDSVLEAINPYWTVTHDAVRGQIRTKARGALKEACEGEFKGNFTLEMTSAGHAIIQVLKTPADYDPRGRSQGWQAMQKKAERALRRKARRKVIPGQVSFEDLGREAEAGER
jgi:hypothetical protein